jgi:hypothetical protein
LQFRLISFLYIALPPFILIQADADNAAAAQTPQQTQSRNTVSGMDVSVGIFGQLTQARIPTTSQQDSNGLFTTQKSQNASPSAGVLGTFHQQFTRWLGYNVNVGSTRFTENYSSGFAFVPSATSSTSLTTNFTRGSIGTNAVETTVAAVVQGPRNQRSARSLNSAAAACSSFPLPTRMRTATRFGQQWSSVSG